VFLILRHPLVEGPHVHVVEEVVVVVASRKTVPPKIPLLPAADQNERKGNLDHLHLRHELRNKPVLHLHVYYLDRNHHLQALVSEIGLLFRFHRKWHLHLHLTGHHGEGVGDVGVEGGEGDCEGPV